MLDHSAMRSASLKISRCSLPLLCCVLCSPGQGQESFARPISHEVCLSQDIRMLTAIAVLCLMFSWPKSGVLC